MIINWSWDSKFPDSKIYSTSNITHLFCFQQINSQAYTMPSLPAFGATMMYKPSRLAMTGAVYKFFHGTFRVKFPARENKNNINSLYASDAIWWHRSGSSLVEVMAWCLTAPSHYLNQFFFSHQWGSVAFTWEQFYSECSSYYFV